MSIVIFQFSPFPKIIAKPQILLTLFKSNSLQPQQYTRNSPRSPPKSFLASLHKSSLTLMHFIIPALSSLGLLLSFWGLQSRWLPISKRNKIEKKKLVFNRRRQKIGNRAKLYRPFQKQVPSSFEKRNNLQRVELEKNENDLYRLDFFFYQTLINL